MVSESAQKLYDESNHKLCVDNDRIFSLLLGLQWIGCIVIALVISPRTWIGERDLVSVHVIAAAAGGFLLSSVPIYFNWRNPGHFLNRYMNVIAQGLYSALLIHLTGGRIETHFHVFGSLAFFAFYRDVRVLMVGTAIVAVDHFVRGVFLPESVFGVFAEGDWRWVEHAAWVVFEDFFLAWSIFRWTAETKAVCHARAEISAQHENAENLVQLRTAELRSERNELAKTNQTIETIYNNVQSGFLMVDKDLCIQKGFTVSCLRLLGSSVTAGMRLPRVLGLGVRDAGHFEAMTEQVFEDVLPEEVSLSQIPFRFGLGDRIVKLEGSAIRGPSGEVQSILFTINDISDLETVEKENLSNKSLMKILQQKNSFSQFAAEARENLKQCLVLLESGDQLKVRFHLHSLKGNATVFGLEDLATLVHEVEGEMSISPKHIESIDGSLRRFFKLNGEVLNMFYEQGFNATYSVSSERLSALEKHANTAEVIQWVGETRLKPAKEYLSPLMKMGINMAERLGKVIEIRLESPECSIDGELLAPVLQTLSHLLRNSIDHGIERRGTVSLSVKNAGPHWLIEVSDDGRGIDSDKVAEAALRRKLVDSNKLGSLNDEQKIDLIFIGGVSTSDEVTQFSGRGIGMSAVADAVRDLNGRIKVISKIGAGTSVQITVPVRQAPKLDRELLVAVS